MKTLTYTVTDGERETVFQGFNRYTVKGFRELVESRTPFHLAVSTYDGETELWLVTDEPGLRSYFAVKCEDAHIARFTF